MSGSTGMSCHCVPAALKIDEQMKVYTFSKDCRSVSGNTVHKLNEDLHHLKQAIVRCSEMLDCKSCSGQFSVMMRENARELRATLLRLPCTALIAAVSSTFILALHQSLQ